MAKLIEILAKEMVEFPEARQDTVGQASNGSLHKGPVSSEGPSWTEEKYTLADDWISTLITKAEWEAARRAYLLTQAPEGATHWLKPGIASNQWLREGDKPAHWNHGCWVEYISLTVADSHFSDAFRLYAEPVPNGAEVITLTKPWDGTGMPPIDTVCKFVGTDAEWHEGLKHGSTVKIIAHFTTRNGGQVAAFTFDHGGGTQVEQAVAGCFRPLPADSVAELADLFTSDNFIGQVPGIDEFAEVLAKKVIEAGYRKVTK